MVAGKLAWYWIGKSDFFCLPLPHCTVLEVGFILRLICFCLVFLKIVSTIVTPLSHYGWLDTEVSRRGSGRDDSYTQAAPMGRHASTLLFELSWLVKPFIYFQTIFHQIHFCVFISWLWDDSNTCSFHIWAAGRARNENSLLFTFRLRIWHCSSGSVDTAIDKKWHRVTMWIWKTKLATTRTLLACRPARKI